MQKKLIVKAFLIVFFGIFSLSAYAQSAIKTRILFIFDESNSMLGHWQSEKKIDVAKTMLIQMVDSLKKIENVELALRMYGHQSPVPPQDCSDTRLEVPFAPNNAEQIKQKLRMTQPKGTTPIARSLEECANDFPDCLTCRNVVILITDGIEACDGDPCAIAMALQSKGIVLKPFVIGIGLEVEFKEAFECVGDFYNATSETDFRNILNQVIKKAVTSTTVQINLLDSFDKPTETNVAITLQNQASGGIVQNLVHTMNYKGVPDTVALPSHIQYSMTVHTIPPVTVNNIKIIEGKHNILKAKTPQGELNIISGAGLELDGTPCIVRQSGSKTTLNVQDMFEPENYITGKYDLEVLTYPRTYFTDVQISQSKTTTLRVPQPGVINFQFPSEGYGGVYLIKDKTVTLVKHFTEIKTESIKLQPGDYVAVFRPKTATQTSMSREQKFTVQSGRSLIISFK